MNEKQIFQNNIYCFHDARNGIDDGQIERSMNFEKFHETRHFVQILRLVSLLEIVCRISYDDDGDDDDDESVTNSTYINVANIRLSCNCY